MFPSLERKGWGAEALTACWRTFRLPSDHSYPSQQSGQQYGQQGAPQYGGAAAGGGYGDGYGAQPQAPAQGGYGGAAYDPAPGYGNGGAAAYEMNEVPKGNDMNSFFSEVSRGAPQEGLFQGIA